MFTIKLWEKNQKITKIVAFSDLSGVSGGDENVIQTAAEKWALKSVLTKTKIGADFCIDDSASGGLLDGGVVVDQGKPNLR